MTVQASTHRGFILRRPDGTVAYDLERDRKFHDDEHALFRAEDVRNELFPDEEMTAELVVVYGFKVVTRDPLRIIYEEASEDYTMATAWEEGKAIIRMLDSGDFISVRDDAGVWRIELAPTEPEGT